MTSLLVLLLLALSTGASDDVSDYIAKGDPGSLIEVLDNSRGGLAAQSFARWRESPLIGNGFGVAADLDLTEIRTIVGIPIGASVESGIALTGLLEQVGALGAAAFVWFVAQAIWPVARNPNAAAVALVVAAVAPNLGEATMASFGGMGLFVWIALGWSSATATSVRQPQVEPSFEAIEV